ncbi:cytochrome P450, partial [Candidatus Bathyarchaeota archaeon]|nr:cytochrome P450 [Candidatus Bathyarchaeota archaeon]
MFGDGIFTQEGKAWKHSREILRPQFFVRQYENLDIIREPFEDLLQMLPSKGGIVDLQPLFFRFTLDVTTAFLIGESIGSLRDPKSAGEHTFASSFDTAQKYVAKRFRLLDFYWMIGGKEFRDACGRVHEFADQIIDRNLSADTKNEDDEATFLHRV